MEQEQHSLSSQIGDTRIMEKKKITSPSDLLKKSLEIYQQKFWKFVGMNCVPILGFLPLAIVLGLFAIATIVFQNSANTIMVSIINIILGLLGIISVLVAIYIGTISQIGLLVLLKNFSSEQKIKEAFKEAMNYFWSYVVIGAITAIFVILWSLLFIIPGIIFAVYYSFSKYTLIFEGYKSMSALKRSKELIKNYWWAVVGRQLFVCLILVLFVLFLSIPELFAEKGSIANIISQIFSNLIYLLISPIVLIYSVLIYKDLVEIKKIKVEKIEK
ncbi:MAG: hypothetical protein U9O66_00965 [Patescibacteria group bacterium]|nr:hypothetical protein [Patescibacteria group bacterium]